MCLVSVPTRTYISGFCFKLAFYQFYCTLCNYYCYYCIKFYPTYLFLSSALFTLPPPIVVASGHLKQCMVPAYVAHIWVLLFGHRCFSSMFKCDIHLSRTSSRGEENYHCANSGGCWAYAFRVVLLCQTPETNMSLPPFFLHSSIHAMYVVLNRRWTLKAVVRCLMAQWRRQHFTSCTIWVMCHDILYGVCLVCKMRSSTNDNTTRNIRHVECFGDMLCGFVSSQKENNVLFLFFFFINFIGNLSHETLYIAPRIVQPMWCQLYDIFHTFVEMVPGIGGRLIIFPPASVLVPNQIKYRQKEMNEKFSRGTNGCVYDGNDFLMLI